MREIDTEISKLIFNDVDFLKCIVFDTEITLENVRKNFEITYNFTNGKKVKTLIDIRNISFNYIPKEVLQYLSDNTYNQYQVAVAVVINNLALKILANFYMKVFKPKVNTKIFDSEEKAMQWLKNNISDKKI